jgi:hypothetical protein
MPYLVKKLKVMLIVCLKSGQAAASGTYTAQ